MEVPLQWRARRGGLFSQDPEAMDGRSGATRHLTQADLDLVEVELQNVVKGILKEWTLRLNQTPLEEASFTALAQPFNWGEDKPTVMQHGVSAQVEEAH